MIDTNEYILNKWNIPGDAKSPVEIPEISRVDLAKLFSELGFTKGAEVGVLFGRYSKILCETIPNLKLSSIDPWLAYGEYNDPKTQEEFDDLYHQTVKSLEGLNCNVIRAKSMDAVKVFDDNSLDFVYIDGNHEFTSEANDIHEWSKKVRPGGIISGHDYIHYRASSLSHSYEVVNAYTFAYRINPWFLTSRMPHDLIRSWFWVKK